MHLLAELVHGMISIPPKYSLSSAVRFIQKKSTTHLGRVYGKQKQDCTRQSFSAREYFESTVGRDEATIRGYIRNQARTING